MINNVSILLSILAVAYVIGRAIRLDKTRPWFERTTGSSSAGPPIPPPVRRDRF
jgi:hypothetical protein